MERERESKMNEEISNEKIIEYLNKIELNLCQSIVYKKEDIFPLILMLLKERLTCKTAEELQ